MAQKIMIIEDQGKIRETEASLINFTVLPHPKTGNLVFVLIGNDIYELQNFEPRTHASWFIDQRVSSTNSIYMATKIDPRLLLLPFIAKTTRYSLMDQIVPHMVGCDRFALRNIAQWKMHECCDVNDKYDDEIFYRHNEEKMMAWLSGKVVRCAKLLGKKRQTALHALSNRGFAAGFNAAAQRARPGQAVVEDTSVESIAKEIPLYSDEDIRLAYQIVGEYLSDEVAGQLASFLTNAGVFKPSSATDASHLAESGSSDGGSGSALSHEEKRKASWEADLELEKETLAYCAGGNSANAGTAGGVQHTSMDKKLKGLPTAAQVNAAKKTATALKGVKSLASYFGAPKK